MIYLGTENYNSSGSVISYFFQNNRFIVCIENFDSDTCNVFMSNGDFDYTIYKKNLIEYTQKTIIIINNKGWKKTFKELSDNMMFDLLKDL